ncbi:VOC family protein [Chloroflexota bacterium]
MFKGVNYVGIGVSDMGRARRFYGDMLGFKEVLFEYEGPLPGMEKITGKPEIRAKVVMLKNQNIGPVGLAMIKLVELLPPDKAEPVTAGLTRIWGDIGLAEVCFNCIDTTGVFKELVGKGVKAALTPASAAAGPFNATANYAYLRDPDNGLVELIHWSECVTYGEGPRTEGVNHVGFGVSDMKTSERFYRQLGFTQVVQGGKVSSADMAGMSTMLPSPPPNLDIQVLANYYGAWIEPLQLLPPHKPSPYRGTCMHLGPMEFAIEVTNLEKAYEELPGKGIKFLSPPQTVEVSSGQWKYAYIAEPDNLAVSLVEPRY